MIRLFSNSVLHLFVLIILKNSEKPKVMSGNNIRNIPSHPCVFVNIKMKVKIMISRIKLSLIKFLKGKKNSLILCSLISLLISTK